VATENSQRRRLLGGERGFEPPKPFRVYTLFRCAPQTCLATRTILVASSWSVGATRLKNRRADLKQMVHGMIDVVAAPYGRSWTQDEPAAARVFFLRLARARLGYPSIFQNSLRRLAPLTHSLLLAGACYPAGRAPEGACDDASIRSRKSGGSLTWGDPNDAAERVQLTSDWRYRPQLTDHAGCASQKTNGAIHPFGVAGAPAAEPMEGEREAVTALFARSDAVRRYDKHGRGRS